jgi:predicted MFS family arabinose efflux permease
LLTGSFLVVFGHMMLSLCEKYYQVILAQAFCIGIGMACLFIPSVAILATYFTTNLPFATGVAASGSSLGSCVRFARRRLTSIGGVLYPIILQQLTNKIGFPWAVRVIGFICLATLIIPNVVMKVRILPPEARKLIDMNAFKDVPFIIFSFACFFTFLGLFQPFFFVQEYAITADITSENFAFYLLSLLNATSIFGRLVPNLVANKTGPLNIIIPCTLMTGVLILCLIGVHTLAGIVVVVLLFGFFSGSLVSLPPTIVVHLTKERKFIGTRMGMSFALISIGALVGSPIGGALIKKGFDKTWIFGGVLAVFGASLMLATRVAHKGWALTAKA